MLASVSHEQPREIESRTARHVKVDAMTEDRSTVTVQDLRCTCCAADVLAAVRAFEGVRSADLDYQQAELRVVFDPAPLDEEGVRDAVRRRGYRCEGDAGGTTTGQLAH